ncbi:MAG: hypothetical protein U0441_35470 [Polyangiaceae bacterium]
MPRREISREGAGEGVGPIDVADHDGDARREAPTLIEGRDVAREKIRGVLDAHVLVDDRDAEAGPVRAQDRARRERRAHARDRLVGAVHVQLVAARGRGLAHDRDRAARRSEIGVLGERAHDELGDDRIAPRRLREHAGRRRAGDRDRAERRGAHVRREDHWHRGRARAGEESVQIRRGRARLQVLRERDLDRLRGEPRHLRQPRARLHAERIRRVRDPRPARTTASTRRKRSSTP